MTEKEYSERAKKAIEMREQNRSIMEISKAVGLYPSFLIRLFDNYEKGKQEGILIAKMYAEGYTIEEISRAVELSPMELRRLLKKYEEYEKAYTRKIIKNMIEYGLSVDRIMRCTGATKELIDEVQTEIERGGKSVMQEVIEALREEVEKGKKQWRYYGL